MYLSSEDNLYWTGNFSRWLIAQQETEVGTYAFSKHPVAMIVSINYSNNTYQIAFATDHSKVYSLVRDVPYEIVKEMKERYTEVVQILKIYGASKDPSGENNV